MAAADYPKNLKIMISW